MIIELLSFRFRSSAGHRESTRTAFSGSMGASSAGLDHSPTTAEMAGWETPGFGFAYPRGSVFDAVSRAGLSWRIYNDDTDAYSDDPARARRGAGQARRSNHARRRPFLHQLRHGQSPRGKTRPSITPPPGVRKVKSSILNGRCSRGEDQSLCLDYAPVAVHLRWRWESCLQFLPLTRHFSTCARSSRSTPPGEPSLPPRPTLP
jgi:hypothetical protein